VYVLLWTRCWQVPFDSGLVFYIYTCVCVIFTRSRDFRNTVFYCVRAYDVIGVARAINLFKCHSEIISEHDRVPREFKFGRARSIFRSYAYRRWYRPYGRVTGLDETRGTVAPVHYYGNLGISGTRGGVRVRTHRRQWTGKESPELCFN